MLCRRIILFVSIVGTVKYPKPLCVFKTLVIRLFLEDTNVYQGYNYHEDFWKFVENTEKKCLASVLTTSLSRNGINTCDKTLHPIYDQRGAASFPNWKCCGQLPSAVPQWSRPATGSGLWGHSRKTAGNPLSSERITAQQDQTADYFLCFFTSWQQNQAALSFFNTDCLTL